MEIREMRIGTLKAKFIFFSPSSVDSDQSWNGLDPSSVVFDVRRKPNPVFTSWRLDIMLPVLFSWIMEALTAERIISGSFSPTLVIVVLRANTEKGICFALLAMMPLMVVVRA